MSRLSITAGRIGPLLCLLLLGLWAARTPALDYRPQWAEVTGIIDADTFVLRFPEAGDGADIEYRANFIGVDAPGVGESQCEAAHVAAITRRLLAGKRVWIEWDSHDKRTGDGRLLVYVHHPDDRDAELNALYIEQGWGWVPRPYPADRKAEYLALEREARAAERGIWGGPCPPDPG